MPLINGAIQIGRSAINTAQAALSVVGNNMANAATPNYSRQRATLVPTQFTEVIPGKFTGTGVTITDISRIADEALNGRIRTAFGESASSQIQQQALTRAESTFNELTTSDLSTRMSQYFGAWGNLQTEPSNATMRSNVLVEGKSLTNFIREIRGGLYQIQQDLDSQVRFQATEANALADQIADMNRQIVTSEAGRAGSSSSLRDQRDGLLKSLGELINITTREVNGGAVNVFIGNEPLIQLADNRGLAYVEKADANGNIQAGVVFADNDQQIDLSSGKLHGLITARDDRLGSLIGNLDSWASSLILEVNQLHSLGQGQQGYAAITSSNDVLDSTVSLANTTATGLDWPVTNGVFNIEVVDDNGLVTTSMIKVDIGISGTDTTLDSLAASINAISGLTSSVDSSGRLNIQASGGSTFKFSAPSDLSKATNVLAVLGVNTFFQGSRGDDIAVRDGLDEAHVVAGSDGQPTNGDFAGQVAQLTSIGVGSLNGLSLTDHFTAMIGQLGAESKSAQDNFTASDVVYQTLVAERESISGVSLDEEAINMIVFQRMLQGSSRYISVINDLLDEVLALAR
jgi:flagellar hook-associated protein 1 FlgK